MENMSINWLFVREEEGFNNILRLRNNQPDTLKTDMPWELLDVKQLRFTFLRQNNRGYKG